LVEGLDSFHSPAWLVLAGRFFFTGKKKISKKKEKKTARRLISKVAPE
jgi:hypothetical protein